MSIVLITEEYKYVLTEEHLDLFVVNAPRADLEICEKWIKIDEMVCCCILASMPSVLQH